MNLPRPRVLASLGAALLLAAPVAGLAQSKPRATAPASPAAAPVRSAAARPAPAAPVAPATVAAPAAAPFEERGPWRVGAVIGYEKDSDAELKGPRLQVEVERDLVPLGGRGQLSFVAGVAWFRGTRSDSASAGGITVTTDITQNLLELVPAFRFAFALQPRLRFFAEVGAGGGFATVSTEAKMTSYPTVSTSSDHGFGVLRLAAGGSYSLNERFRVGVLLPAWSKRYGHEGSSSSLSFSALAAYAF